MRLLGLERGYPLVLLLAYTPYAAATAVLATGLALVLRRRRAALVAGLSALVLAVQELTPALDAELRGAFAHRVVRPRPGTPGTGIYSRLPLRRRPVPRGTVFAWTRAEVDGRVDLLSVHPPAPLRSALMAAWRRDLRALPPVERVGPPRVLAGDFNATLDHRELRRVLHDGYRDAAGVAGSGLRGTWPNGTRRLPPVAIDHVLVDGECAVREARTLSLRGSDHSPVLAEVACPES